MPQADFTYDAPADAAGLQASVAVFADRETYRSQVCHDLREGGFRIAQDAPVSSLLDGDPVLLGNAVLLHCPHVDAEMTAALARLDMRIANSGTPLIVTTSLEALDVVFASLEQSAPQILVDSGRAELAVAVGRLVGEISGLRLRELSETEQMTLLRLTEQVEAIARKIDEFAEDGPGRLTDSRPEFRGAEPLARRRIAFPKPEAVRQIIRQRQARSRFFDSELFADPAWDMLLDLTAASGEGEQVSVTSLCIAADVPATTALRWIRQMVDQGIFTRVEDECDKRRAFIALSDTSRDAMARYFAEIEEPVALAA